MKKLLLVSIISALGSLVAVAQYSIHSLSGDVKLKKGMQFVPVAKGTSLTAADVLELGEGASIEIFNTTNSDLQMRQTRPVECVRHNNQRNLLGLKQREKHPRQHEFLTLVSIRNRPCLR